MENTGIFWRTRQVCWLKWPSTPPDAVLHHLDHHAKEKLPSEPKREDLFI
jgi:hypothetical protein